MHSYISSFVSDLSEFLFKQNYEAIVMGGGVSLMTQRLHF